MTATASYEKSLIDHEILRNIVHGLKGIEVSDETLAVEVINKVGSGGHFLSQEHTRSHVFKEHLISELADRRIFEIWSKEDGKNIEERANERVKQILNDYEPEPLDKKIEKELQRVVREIASQQH